MGRNKLTQKKLLVLYLRGKEVFISDEGLVFASPDITQEGIARALKIGRSNVPRLLKSLVERGYVKEWKARVNGYTHLKKVYTLTPKGIQLAKEIEQRIHTEEYINTNTHIKFK